MLAPHRWAALGLLAAAPLSFVLGPGYTVTFDLGDLWEASPLWLLLLVAPAEVVPLWWAKRRPLGALAVCVTALLVGQAFDLPATSADFAVLVALYLLGAWAPPRRALLGCVGAAAALFAFMAAAGQGQDGGLVVAAVAAACLAGLPTLLGLGFAARRARATEPVAATGGPERPEGAALDGRAASGDGPLALLTEREAAVLHLVGEGLTNAEIAERLVVSRETVKTHVSNVLTKLDARDRTHAVTIAHRSRLLAKQPPTSADRTSGDGSAAPP
jgi:DNA-binding CsgD family transcriptional regulator